MNAVASRVSSTTATRSHAELTVVVVSYNTRDLTLKALATLLENAGPVKMDVIVWDNASQDGSADAIEERFSHIKLVRSSKNLGFALANNRAIETVATDHILLLNPDTETHPDAICNLLQFARQNPEAGIVGGRTVFPDGSLNIASCWNRITLWSLFCHVTGLTRLFPNSTFFSPEAIGGWQRDTVRKVDIVVGCFLLASRNVWEELGGFDPKYFMFGEEADLCLRAKAAGYQPMITPDAQIMHLVGGSYSLNKDRAVKVFRGRATLIRDHWPKWKAPLGLSLLWLSVATRFCLSAFLAAFSDAKLPAKVKWSHVWKMRSEWLSGY